MNRRFANIWHTVNKALKDPRMLALWVLAGVLVPNLVLPYTERWPVAHAIAGVLMPAGLYMVIISAFRRIGVATWAMLPFMILAAFQLVLLHLYGRGLIGVDMFLNVFTTSFSEATTLLSNLAMALFTVVLLYVTALSWGVYAIVKKLIVPSRWRRHMFYGGIITLVSGIATALAICLHTPVHAVVDTTFPANVVENLIAAINRTNEFADYDKTSASFAYHARSHAPADRRELYIIVIGETSRGENWQLNGYGRPTNPRLSSEPGLTYFPRAFSESNTTHKSVPMLISAASAENFDSIYCYKSIITAFKEAGYKTAFFTNQTPNRSYTQFFGNEADNVRYIQNIREGVAALDTELVPMVQHEIDKGNLKQLIVVHTYGSHFRYSDRYPGNHAFFKPDDITEADARFRDRLINAYDNSIRYTDLVLHEIISLARDAGCRASVIYASDHGEDIFDDSRGLFLHASPTPSARQLHVGACCWLSDSLMEQTPEAPRNLRQNHAKFISPQKSLFNTIIGLAQISTPYYHDDQSLVSDNYRAPRPLYVTDKNEALSWDCVPFQEPDLDYLKKFARITIQQR